MRLFVQFHLATIRDMTPLIAIPEMPQGFVESHRAHTELPELPGLTQLLRRATALPRSSGWRAGALAALGAGSNTAACAVAARAVPAIAPGTQACFATPLHVLAGISRVHLPPGGLLELEPAEAKAWQAAFNAEFGPQAQLHAAAPGGAWILVAPFAQAAQDAAPESLMGEALERAPAADEAQRALRLLGAEVEMWLAAHALNREREARHEPVLNVIWFSDGARVTPVMPVASLRGIVSGGRPDAWLAGLSAHAKVPVTIASGWDAALRILADHGSAHTDLLVVPAPDTAGSASHYVQGLEDHWFAPVAKALEAGEMDGVRLQIGVRAWRVRRRPAIRWLRWRRSWWQMIGQDS
jgi:hypothetical protein